MLAGAVLVTALASGNGDAAAQGSLDARYQVTLGGVSFGRGAWQVNVSDGQFTSAVSGTTTGVMRDVQHRAGHQRVARLGRTAAR